MEEGMHVVFYRQESDGVVIVRFLHHRMLPEINFMAEDEE